MYMHMSPASDCVYVRSIEPAPARQISNSSASRDSQVQAGRAIVVRSSIHNTAKPRRVKA